MYNEGKRRGPIILLFRKKGKAPFLRERTERSRCTGSLSRGRRPPAATRSLSLSTILKGGRNESKEFPFPENLCLSRGRRSISEKNSTPTGGAWGCPCHSARYNPLPFPPGPYFSRKRGPGNVRSRKERKTLAAGKRTGIPETFSEGNGTDKTGRGSDSGMKDAPMKAEPEVIALPKEGR